VKAAAVEGELPPPFAPAEQMGSLLPPGFFDPMGFVGGGSSGRDCEAYAAAVVSSAELMVSGPEALARFSTHRDEVHGAAKGM
jgi:hypothetical protein